MENEQTQQHHHLWQQISPLLPALLSTQRASWEQGVTAQALLELYLALHSSSASSSSSTSQSNPNLPDPNSGAALIPGPTTTTTQAPAQAETDTLLLYIYNLTHDALVRASDGRLATRINGEDASALDPACVGEAVLFMRDMYMYFDGLDNLGSTPDERSRWQTGPERMVRFLVRDAVRIAGSGASSSASSTIGDHEDNNNIEIPPSGTTSTGTGTGTGTGAISHLLRSPQLWSDGGYMGPPFLAAAAVSRSLSRSCSCSAGITNKTKDGHNDNLEWIDLNTTISPSSLLTEAFDQILLYARYLPRPCPGTGTDTDPGSGTGSGSGAEAAPQKKILLAHIYDGTLGTFAPIDVQHGQYGHAAWGVGMGWFVNGIVRVMRTVERALCTSLRSSDSHDHLRWLERWLKEDDDDREGGKHSRSSRIDRTTSLLVALLDGILSHQRPQDGLFHNVVDDGGTFVETNLAQMLAAAIFRICTLYYEYDDDSNDQDGKLPRPRPSVVVRALRGVLDRDKLSAYEAAAERMYVAARGKRDRWGLVQGVCGSPGFSGPGTATEGQAWAVLMEVARWEWCRIRRVDTTT